MNIRHLKETNFLLCYFQSLPLFINGIWENGYMCASGWVPLLFSWNATSMLIGYVLSCSVVSISLRPHGLEPTRLLCPWGFSRQEQWSGFPFPPPGDLPTQGSNPCLPHCRQIFYHLREALLIVYTPIQNAFGIKIRRMTLKWAYKREWHSLQK